LFKKFNSLNPQVRLILVVVVVLTLVLVAIPRQQAPSSGNAPVAHVTNHNIAQLPFDRLTVDEYGYRQFFLPAGVTTLQLTGLDVSQGVRPGELNFISSATASSAELEMASLEWLVHISLENVRPSTAFYQGNGKVVIALRVPTVSAQGEDQPSVVVWTTLAITFLKGVTAPGAPSFYSLTQYSQYARVDSSGLQM
jgi:hypothetical protein